MRVIKLNQRAEKVVRRELLRSPSSSICVPLVMCVRSESVFAGERRLRGTLSIFVDHNRLKDILFII